MRFAPMLRAVCVVLVLSFATSAASAPDAMHGSYAGLVRLPDSRKMYLECRGTGRPVVILEAGLRVRSDYWSENTATPAAISVFPGVAKLTRVCAYDRPGTVIGTAISDRSRSDPVRMPRSAQSVVADLHALIKSAHLSGPFVMVGHSTGGLLVRLYAHSYPSDVAGLVLVDALPDGLQDDLTPTQYAAFLRLNTERGNGLESYSDYETIPFDPAFATLRRLQKSSPLKQMPLVVLLRGQPVELSPAGLPPGFSEALERAWRSEQRKLVAIEPGARQIVATRSNHFIMLQEPGLVITAVRGVVDAVRRGSRVPIMTGYRFGLRRTR